MVLVGPFSSSLRHFAAYVHGRKSLCPAAAYVQLASVVTGVVGSVMHAACHALPSPTMARLPVTVHTFSPTSSALAAITWQEPRSERHKARTGAPGGSLHS